MRSHTLAQYQKPPVPIEQLGAHRDEQGLIRLPSHHATAGALRVLSEGLNSEERIAAVPWCAAHGAEDEWFPQSGRKILHGLVALELNVSPGIAKQAIKTAEEQELIEIRHTESESQRPIAMRVTESGLLYLKDNPQTVLNVSLFVFDKKRSFAEELWREVASQQRALGSPAEPYQGDAITSFLGLNTYIAGLQEEHKITLAALDSQAPKEASSKQ